MHEVIIREATAADLEQVLAVERAAFAGEDEARLVQDLLEDTSAQPVVSLLALQADKAVGHILFTCAQITSKPSPVVALLAPLAVIPEYQKQGIGGKLIKQGLAALAALDTDLVFVLGYPDYYARHGFKPAGELGFDAPFPILEKNADAWMVQALRQDILGTFKGQVMCAEALNKPEYWKE